MPGSVFVRPRRAVRSRGSVPSPRRTPCWLLALLGIALALSGCLQEARNAGNNFDFNNPVDPTPTVNSSGIVIVEVDQGLKIATLVNNSGIGQVMTGWTLVYPGSTAYTFPSAFTLNVSAYVRVHSDTGTDNATDLWGSAIVWSGSNTVTLTNGSTVVFQCRVGFPTC